MYDIIIIIIIIIIGIQPLGRSGQRPEFSQAIGMALVRCILGKFLGVVCHCFPAMYDIWAQIMEDVLVKLNIGLLWPKMHSTNTFDLELRKKLLKGYIWSMALYGAETWTLRAVDRKYMESFEMWCWRRMEKISWTEHVRNEEVLLRVNEQRNILHEISKRKAKWIGHILCRNCLPQRVTEGKIKGEMEVIRRRGRRLSKLLDDLKDRRGYSHLKEEALDRTMWRGALEEALDLSSDRILNE